MRDLRENLIDILKAEVKPAVGCTEPVAVALACAKAKELLGEDVVKNKILVSPNVYKNAMCVGIPGTERLGLKIAVAMGLVGGKSEDGLTLLEGLTDEQVKKSEEYMDATPISIEPLDTKEKVVIDVTLEGENNKSRVIIKTKHDNFVFLQQNNLVLLDEVDGFAEMAEVQTTEKKENIMDHITIEEIVIGGGGIVVSRLALGILYVCQLLLPCRQFLLQVVYLPKESDLDALVEPIDRMGWKLGEYGNINSKVDKEILLLRL